MSDHIHPYNPVDWYWFVGGNPTQVWSSKRFSYVPVSDQEYATWLTDPLHITSINPHPADLYQVMQEFVLPLYFNTASIEVTSTGTPDINAAYSLGSNALSQIGMVARDVAAGFGFPSGEATFQYPDAAGILHDLTEANIQDLYKAMRSQIASITSAVQTLALGGAAVIPSNAVTIP